MRKVVGIAMTLLFGTGAAGQSLLDCIDPDVLHGLILPGQAERPLVVTAAVPSELAPLRMPREFSWIGSAERSAGRVDANTAVNQVTGAYRSSLPPEAARVAAAGALAASGWEVRPGPGIGMGIFVSAASPISQQACRDGKPVNVTVGSLDGITYVLLVIQRNSSNTLCNQPVRPDPVASTGLEKHMPRLAMPPDPVTGNPVAMQGSGGSYGPGSLSARVDYTLNESAGNAAEHFARQMAEQGWTKDANWNGTSTAGSSWSKRLDATTRLQGTLAVTSLGERQMLTQLRVVSLQ